MANVVGGRRKVPPTSHGSEMLAIQKILNVSFFPGGETRWCEKKCIFDISLCFHIISIEVITEKGSKCKDSSPKSSPTQAL